MLQNGQSREMHHLQTAATVRERPENVHQRISIFYWWLPAIMKLLRCCLSNISFIVARVDPSVE